LPAKRHASESKRRGAATKAGNEESGILMLPKVRSHRFGRNAGFIRQDVELRIPAAA